jgi:hypothetical protein
MGAQFMLVDTVREPAQVRPSSRHGIVWDLDPNEKTCEKTPHKGAVEVRFLRRAPLLKRLLTLIFPSV